MSAGDQRLRVISGVGVKGPACFLVEAGDARILIDIGKGPERNAVPDLEGLSPLDAVILSHAHPDHVGSLSQLSATPPREVWATGPVWGEIGPSFPLVATRRTLPLSGEVEVAGIPVETGRSGHAPGGVWLRLSVGGGLLYLGDIDPMTRFYAYDPPGPVRTVILDASYGGWDRSVDEARAAVLDAVGPGTLLPAPPGGRGPDLALALHERGCTPALDVDTRAAIEQLCTGAGPGLLLPGRAAELSDLLRAEVLPDPCMPPGGMPVIAASGSADSGLAAALANAGGPDAPRHILFTGHLPSDSPGARMVAEGRAEQMRWPVHPTRGAQAALLDALKPARALPAFCTVEGARLLRDALGPVLLDADVREVAL